MLWIWIAFLINGFLQWLWLNCFQFINMSLVNSNKSEFVLVRKRKRSTNRNIFFLSFFLFFFLLFIYLFIFVCFRFFFWLRKWFVKLFQRNFVILSMFLKEANTIKYTGNCHSYQDCTRRNNWCHFNWCVRIAVIWQVRSLVNWPVCFEYLCNNVNIEVE